MKNRNLPHHDNWSTPKDFYENLDNEFHFDYDPCPINGTNGLLGNWGERNFVNPPYSRKLKEAFVLKAIEQLKLGKMSVLLLPVSTSTKLFHDYIKPNATEIRFIKGRISFEGVNSFGEKVGKGKSPMHDSMLIIFKNNYELKKCRNLDCNGKGEVHYDGDDPVDFSQCQECLKEGRIIQFK